MAAIKRELKVKFSTTGDGEVTRSIVKVDDSLKGAAASGGEASKSIGDLSESIDKGLENSVGKAFKATDRLNSIVGQVTGAIGLATLAVTGAVAAYKALTAGSDRAAKTQALIAERLKRVQAEAAAAAKSVNELAAAQGGAAGFLSGAELVQLQEAEKRRNALLKEREELTARQLATEAKLAKMTGGARAQTVSVLSEERRALEDKIDATQFEIQLLGQVAAKRRSDTLATQDSTKAITANTEALKARAVVLQGLDADEMARFRDGLKMFQERAKADIDAEAEALEARRRLSERFYEWRAEQEGKNGPEGPDVGQRAEELSKFSDVFKEALKGLSEGEQKFAIGAIEATAASTENLANGFAGAAAAALVYGESFGEVAAQAVAALAAQATTEALFQAAKGLAYLAASFFDPRALLAAKAAFGSAAAFGAIAAVTVPVARATGSASGAGGGALPSGPSARDAGIGGPRDAVGGDSTIVINVGTPIATEADIGAAVARGLNANGRRRGSVRVNRRAIRGG